MKKEHWLALFLQFFLFVGMFLCIIRAQASVTEISNLTANGGVSAIDVQWQIQSLQETEGIILLRKENSCPVGSEDGQELYQGNGKSFKDRSAKEKTSYCYGALVRDASGYISKIKISELVGRKGIGEFVWDILQSNLFIAVGLVVIVILAWLNILKKKFFA